MSVYGLTIDFTGGNIRLKIEDSAKWVLGPFADFNAGSGNTVIFNISINQPFVSLQSADSRTPVVAHLIISVDSTLATLTLDVLNDGIVQVKSPVDSFVDLTPGQRVHHLKLK
ncbi:hypothetical protein HDF09_001586 [Edaphobacter lichenicola]|uniref:Uncharacterized protein n=1 Tax=Tunturiibacter empetritectus TaxID=3069691 RepID=A0A7W8MR55_9BACT|nr:hypothetical protein [Edaphobacter lichenicola]